MKGWIEANMAGKEKITKELLVACKAWMLVESERRENTPVPDPVLRENYRWRAVELTKRAIARAEGKEV